LAAFFLIILVWARAALVLACSCLIDFLAEAWALASSCLCTALRALMLALWALLAAWTASLDAFSDSFLALMSLATTLTSLWT